MNAVELKAFMDKQGFDEASLADTVGVTKQAVNHWVTARRKIPETTCRLLRMFDAQPQFVAYFKGFKSND